MKPLPARPTLATLTLAAALLGTAAAAWATLPPPSPEAQAKAAEAKAKAAHAGKVAAFQTCQAQDRVVAEFQAGLRAAGKPVPTPVPTPACVDPGPFVYTPPGAPAPKP